MRLGNRVLGWGTGLLVAATTVFPGCGSSDDESCPALGQTDLVGSLAGRELRPTATDCTVAETGAFLWFSAPAAGDGGTRSLFDLTIGFPRFAAGTYQVLEPMADTTGEAARIEVRATGVAGRVYGAAGTVVIERAGACITGRVDATLKSGDPVKGTFSIPACTRQNGTADQASASGGEDTPAPSGGTAPPPATP